MAVENPLSNQDINEEPDAGTTFHHLTKGSCSGCSPLSLEAIVKAPSIALAGNFESLNRVEYLTQLLTTPPIFFEVSQLLQCHSTCALCRMIYSEARHHMSPEATQLYAFKCAGLGDIIQGVWIYEPPVGWLSTPIVKLYCHAQEGKHSSTFLDPSWSNTDKFCPTNSILCYPISFISVDQSSSVGNGNS